MANDFPHQVRAYVNDDDLDELEDFCRANAYTRSAGMRHLIRLGMKTHQQDQDTLRRARLAG